MQGSIDFIGTEVYSAFVTKIRMSCSEVRLNMGWELF
jgi:hypothetical protein